MVRPMGSKLTDRLKRLHSSRVRVNSETSVSAEPQPENAPTPHEERETRASRPRPKDDGGDPEPNPAIREQLERHRRLATKTAPGTARRAAAGRRHAAPAPRLDDNSVGEHIGQLRTHARGLIEAGLSESALPLLHEIASISPTNPFALTELARYYRAAGRDDIASLYESRLKSTAPY